MAIDHTETVKNYYGKTLTTSEDLKTDACCAIVAYPKRIRDILREIHEEVSSKFYGCGLVVPQKLRGAKVLDLGSGSGRDCYVISKLVGETGHVTGVDMTPEQLMVAQRHIEYHMERFNYMRPNVEFREGNIERLQDVGLEDESFDIIVSNCVLNLAKNKQNVLDEAWRVLKQGGEFYFSDVYCARRMPEELLEDEVLYGECLSGALYWNDFHSMARKAGFADPRIVEWRPLEISNDAVKKKVKDLQFYSVTYRLFKIDELDDHCEDYGQAVRYTGTLCESPSVFNLDLKHQFQKGKVETVCANTFRMLQESRFAEHFDFFGDFKTHYGLFECCGIESPFQDKKAETEDESCCC